MNKSQRILLVCTLVAFTCVACVSSEFRQHFDAGWSACDAGDFNTGIRELEAAVAIDPNVSSLAWHKLSYCYSSVGRGNDSWIAIRKAVILNPISSERRQAFYAAWNQIKQHGISTGETTQQVRSRLGDADVVARGQGNELWTYGLVVLEFKQDRLVAIKE